MNKSQPVKVKVIVDKPRRKMKDDSLTARIINTAMHLKLFQGFLKISKNKIFQIIKEFSLEILKLNIIV